MAGNLQEAKQLVAQWLTTYGGPDVIPSDDGNYDALLYNLVHFLRDGEGFRCYDYAPEQDAELNDWRANRGLNY